MAAGHPPPTPTLNFGGIYVNTSHAKVGDKGSEVLPRAPSGTTWTAGTTVEVSWVIEANHGGGAKTAPSFVHFLRKNDRFIKTGSGHTYIGESF